MPPRQVPRRSGDTGSQIAVQQEMLAERSPGIEPVAGNDLP
jgi:hypothetical protein